MFTRNVRPSSGLGVTRKGTLSLTKEVTEDHKCPNEASRDHFVSSNPIISCPLLTGTATTAPLDSLPSPLFFWAIDIEPLVD